MIKSSSDGFRGALHVRLQSVSAIQLSELVQTIIAPVAAAQVTIHLIDSHGQDRGALGTAKFTPGDRKS